MCFRSGIRVWRLVFCVVVALIAIPRGGAVAQITIEQAAKTLDGLSDRTRLERLETAARKEGRIRWAATTNLGYAQPVMNGFKKKYPSIEVEFDRVSGRVLTDRIVREYRAKQYNVDILGTSSITSLAVKEAGVVGSYKSPETGDMNSSIKDPNGFWVTHYVHVLGIVCNKSRLKTAVKEWKDFLDPKWKGDFSIDPERFQWFHALRGIYGDEEAKKLITGYVQNGAQIRRGGTLQVQLVAAGEYACALGIYLGSAYPTLKTGAPLAFFAPEPILLSPDIQMIAKYPPHPYAAILFYDYLLSTEGLSHLTRNSALYPTRPNLVTVPEIKALQGKPIHFIDVEDQSRNFEKNREMYLSLLKK